MELDQLIDKLQSGDLKSLARCISLVENDSPGFESILENLIINYSVPVIGITGPPGAGKSTLVNGLVTRLLSGSPGARIGVLVVDPTSPFTHGSLLGDRLRLTNHFNNPNVFIRSLATRGALGGLSAKTIEITDILRSAGFDYLIIETVGVGQSEVDIASLADTTLVVFVPESGDEIQTIKSGIMEIADIFLVNKSDREGSASLEHHLKSMLHLRPFSGWQVPVIGTIATSGNGIDKVVKAIHQHQQWHREHESAKKHSWDQVVRLIGNYLIRKIDLAALKKDLDSASAKPDFNLYRFLSSKFS